MSRLAAIRKAETYFDSGKLWSDLARRVAMPTESQVPGRDDVLLEYLDAELRPQFEKLGFSCEILTHPEARSPFLYAERIEDENLLTVLGYGHGDVIRGLEGEWKQGLSPWVMQEDGGCWYGRGVADNKGQHTVNLAALAAVIEIRGRLGFNAKYLVEMGEETGSLGLRELCEQHQARFAADIFIASDGPRLGAKIPTIFLGARGGLGFDLWIDARKGAHHSGNWGGVLSNPAIQLAHAIASLSTAKGKILISEWLPQEIPQSVRRALSGCELAGDTKDIQIDPDWGEPGLTTAEKLFGWCSFDILAFKTGTPEAPVSAIPASAWARGHIRFVVDIDPERILPALRAHLDRNGFDMVRVAKSRDKMFRATRLNPEDPRVQWVKRSIETTIGQAPTILPNLGGSLPNDAFAEVLGLPTIWIPHSYPGCSQHAPNEHLPPEILRQGLSIMAGVYWDLGTSSAASILLKQVNTLKAPC